MSLIADWLSIQIVGLRCNFSSSKNDKSQRQSFAPSVELINSDSVVERERDALLLATCPDDRTTVEAGNIATHGASGVLTRRVICVRKCCKVIVQVFEGATRVPNRKIGRALQVAKNS